MLNDLTIYRILYIVKLIEKEQDDDYQRMWGERLADPVKEYKVSIREKEYIKEI